MAKGLFRSAKNKIKYWWASTIVGSLAIILGILCFTMPAATLTAMTYIFIIAFFLGGIVDIVFAVANRNILSNWGRHLSIGILDLLFGVVLLIISTSTLTAILLYFVGFGMLFHSVGALIDVAGIRDLRPKGWRWLLALVIVSVLLSLSFLIGPLVFKGKFVVALISLAFIIFGAFKIYMSLQARKIYKEINNLGDSFI